jgi:glycosyltransferase involved in cell wall biosynthesis
MGRIIANLVARNEADNYLAPVLDRLSTQVDTIIFTDDCSTDGTVELAKKYTDKIQVLPEPLFAVNEGSLRQRSWEFLESVAAPTEDDWILAIDADELLYETKYPIRELVSDTGYDIINIMFYHMWSETSYRTDGGWHPHGSTRLFRWQPGGIFNDRKLACSSEPTYVAWNAHYFRNRVCINSGLKMKHLSYIKDEDKAKKYKRYSELDGGAFHNNSHIQSIADPVEKVALEEWKW